MERPKPITPYTRLLCAARKFASAVTYPRKAVMFMYPMKKLGDGWRLDDLYQRTKAADQLGYDVVLVANEDGLKVLYRVRVPEWPPEFS